MASKPIPKWHQCIIENSINVWSKMASMSNSQICTRNPRPLCDGVVSHGAEFGFCQPHAQKYTQNKCVHDLWAPCGVLHFFVIMLRSQFICIWWTTVILITGKTRRPQNSAACWDQDGTGSGIPISGLHLWSDTKMASMSDTSVVSMSDTKIASMSDSKVE